jgi:hypothetical protein
MKPFRVFSKTYCRKFIAKIELTPRPTRPPFYWASLTGPIEALSRTMSTGMAPYNGDGQVISYLDGTNN